MALESSQPLTEMSKSRPVRRADNRVSANAGASTFHNPKGLHGLYRDKCYCYEDLKSCMDSAFPSDIDEISRDKISTENKIAALYVRYWEVVQFKF
jgi:hypothetical protein